MKLTLLLAILNSTAFASEINIDSFSDSLEFAQVTNVVANQKSNGSWCFSTSVAPVCKECHHDLHKADPK